MHIVSLPMFSAADTVDNALSALRAAGKGAIVLHEPGASALIFGGALAVAQHDGLSVLAEVQEREPLTGPEEAALNIPIASRGFGFTDLAKSFTKWLGKRQSARPAVPELDDKTPYLLLEADTKTARIVTHEYTYDNVALPGIYVCDRNYKHAYPRPRVSDGDSCVKCKPDANGSVGTVRLT